MKSRSTTRLVALVLLIAMAAVTTRAGDAAAAGSCAFSVGTLNFGTVDLTANTTFDTAVDFEVSCQDGTPGQDVQVCVNLGTGSGGANGANAPRYLTRSGSLLGYNVFSDASRSTVWGSYTGGGSPREVLLTLDANGNASQSGTMYGRIYAGQQTPPTGTYTSTFGGGAPQAFLAWSEYTGGSCAALGTSNETAFSFMASASYPASCTVSASTMDFGTMTDVQTAVDSSAALSATCSASTPYAISLGDGLNATGPMQRAMIHGGQQLAYGLYQDSARLAAWGAGGNAMAATGSGLPQSQTIFGRIPAQVTPPPGIYQDTVVVTVSY